MAVSIAIRGAGAAGLSAARAILEVAPGSQCFRRFEETKCPSRMREPCPPVENRNLRPGRHL